MGFPILLFMIAIGFTLSDRLRQITLGGLFAHGVIALVVLIGVFSWFYPARVVRAQVLALRESEFVEAARMVGASDARILRKHLLPHVVGTIVVYATLMVATTIFLEAALSYLGVGISLPDASWGNIIAQQYGTLLHPGPARPEGGGPIPNYNELWASLFPTIGIVVSVFAFNLLGESLQNALDPRRKL
jgi:peptide/nickel transport system permease protein